MTVLFNPLQSTHIIQITLRYKFVIFHWDLLSLNTIYRNRVLYIGTYIETNIAINELIFRYML